MRQIPKAKIRDEVKIIFEQLEFIGDDNINGKNIILFCFNLYCY
jgi:hypothetical protein